MAFDKIQSLSQPRTRFDLDDSNDRRIIHEFEEELKPFTEKTLIIFGKSLTGFDLYLHEKNMFRYSKKYPDGAVYFDNLAEYEFVRLKWAALGELNQRRIYAKNKEAEEFKNLELATA